MTAPEPPVDELVAQAEMRRQASARLPQIIARVTGVALDERRLVQATTNASGELLDLVLHPAAVSFGGKELARMIMEAATLAADYARQQCYNELALVFGDVLTAEVEALIGPAPARVAGWDTAPAARIPSEADVPDATVSAAEADPDDALSFDPSTLRSDR